MTDEQQRVLACVTRWLEIKARWEERPFAPSPTQLVADILHSALLQRLLTGLEPHPIPPPLAFSYPWYALVDDGYALCFEVWEGNSYPTHIVINQGLWAIVNKASDDEYIVSYRDDAPHYRLTRLNDERINAWELRRE